MKIQYRQRWSTPFFGVEVHDFPPRFILESIAKEFRDFIGSFEEYDAKQTNNGYKNFIWIMVKSTWEFRWNNKRKSKFQLQITCMQDFNMKNSLYFVSIVVVWVMETAFCPLRLRRHFHESDMGWDITLRAL